MMGVKRGSGVCRVANKVGKECAIKVGMGLEDRAVEEKDGFGVGIWGVPEVVSVAIGTEAADDGGAGRSNNWVALGADGDFAVVADTHAGLLAPDIGPPRTVGSGTDDGAFFGEGLLVSGVGCLAEFAVDFVVVGVRDELVEQVVGT